MTSPFFAGCTPLKFCTCATCTRFTSTKRIRQWSTSQKTPDPRLRFYECKRPYLHSHYSFCGKQIPQYLEVQVEERKSAQQAVAPPHLRGIHKDKVTNHNSVSIPSETRQMRWGVTLQRTRCHRRT